MYISPLNLGEKTLIIKTVSRIKMALRKNLCLVICVIALNGCSVLGFATDLALISASDRNTKPGDQIHKNNYELYFTQEGIKHDVEAVKSFMEGISDSQNDFSPLYQEKT